MSGKPDKKQEDRQSRLKKALRANLRRRKQHARARIARTKSGTTKKSY